MQPVEKRRRGRPPKNKNVQEPKQTQATLVPVRADLLPGLTQVIATDPTSPIRIGKFLLKY